MELPRILENLGNAPAILEDLVRAIPEERIRLVRKPGKWTIHDQVSHIAEAQTMLLERLGRFLREAKPVFEPYFPGTGGAMIPSDIGIDECLRLFRDRRAELIGGMTQVPEGFWDKRAVHPEYEIYTPYVMARHIMMHDYLHMYRIEGLWLTRPEYLA